MNKDLAQLCSERDLTCYRAYATLTVLGDMCGERLPQWAQERIKEHAAKYEALTAQINAGLSS